VKTKKQQLAKLDPRLQFGLVALGLVLLAFAGYSFVVSPQNAESAQLVKQVNAEQLQVYKRREQLKAGLHPPTIQTADLYRLARAMPDRTDMPGIILTLSDVARAAGITFNLIAPVVSGASAPTGSYEVQRMHLQFSGDFYGLSDFLYRLRNLVVVHNGQLDASGRLFNVDTVTFSAGVNAFPQISADLFLNAYVYASTPSAPAPVAPTTTASATSLPGSASATGATG